MFKLIKSIMAQFSYFIEKYMSADSIIWTIIFMSLYCAVIFAVILKIITLLFKYNKSILPIYTGITIICSFAMNRLISTAYTWDSKLQRVMSNFEYMMSFQTNRQIFLSALNLPDNTYNQDHIFKIAMYLNDSQWQDVLNKAGEGASWYFAKIQKAFQDILKLGNWHLSLGITYQGLLTFLPVIAIALLGIFFVIRKKKKLTGCMILGTSALCMLENFGTGIFTCLTLYIGILICMFLEKRFSKKKNILPDSD